MNVLVLDVGTSSMRGVVYGEDGRPQSVHRQKYGVRSFGEIVEQSPDVWKNALIAICRDVLEEGVEIGALSLTCQRSSLIPVDGEGTPLRDAIMWQDTRNSGIVNELAPHAGYIAALAGARPNTVFSGTKMAWFRRMEPALYARTLKLCTIADYLTFLITGGFVTDETYGSRSLLMGLRSRRWEPELLEIFGIDEAKLCPIVEPGSVSGTVSRKFSALTGIPEGLPLISAGGDQQCGALGQGLFNDSLMTVTLGTSACILRCVGAGGVPENPKGTVCGAHTVPGSYILESSMLTCGAMFDWVRRTFLDCAGRENIDRAVMISPPGANGVTVIPHFQGRGTPDWNSSARGGFLNLSLSTSRADMVRAALESIVFEIVNNIEAMEKFGGPVDILRVGGGFTEVPGLCQILADASGKTVLCGKDTSESTSFGAWMSAAVTLGLRESYERAFDGAAIGTKRTEPNEGSYEAYRQGRERMNDAYLRLYGNS